MKPLRIPALILVAALLALGGCSQSEAPAATQAKQPAAPAAAPAAPTPAAPADHAAHKAAAPGVSMPKAPAGAGVRFGALKDGQLVKGAATEGKVPVAIKMVAEGITVKPAGMPEEGSGHHHVLVDTGALPMGTVVPADETHIHFGKGQTEATVPLAPGEHTLTLQFADGIHRSYGPDLSASIKIKVESI